MHLVNNVKVQSYYKQIKAPLGAQPLFYWGEKMKLLNLNCALAIVLGMFCNPLNAKAENAKFCQETHSSIIESES